jgi:hypothetical protein
VYFVYFVVKPPRRICRAARVYGKKGIWYNVGRNEDVMGLVKTRRLMAMQKQQRAKAGMKPPMPKDKWKPAKIHKERF